jgi:hypothetical protein
MYKLYDYECIDCHNIHEEMIDSNEDIELYYCPKCKLNGSNSLCRRLISLTSAYTGAMTKAVNRRLGKHGKEFRE